MGCGVSIAVLKGTPLSRQRTEGICCICGVEGKLSFEHVPPESAFNHRPIVIAEWDQIQKSIGDVSSIRGRTKQRGFGRYTLCERCNNRTGHYYRAPYADWAYQGMRLHYVGCDVSHFYHNFYIFPLRVFEQILCMFMSACGPTLRKSEPTLEYLVRYPRFRCELGDIRLFIFDNYNFIRKSGVAVGMNTRSGVTNIFAEFIFPPFGYVLALDGKEVDERMTEITHFSRFSFEEFRCFPINLNTINPYTYLPGDFRSQSEVAKDMATATS